MKDHELVFRFHALQQMALRGISEIEVRDVLERGEVIESYPDDLPFPSRLVSASSDGRQIHVVAMDEPAIRVTYIITAYQPDPRRWSKGFRTRKRS